MAEPKITGAMRIMVGELEVAGWGSGVGRIFKVIGFKIPA